jgi:hypothetical protein
MIEFNEPVRPYAALQGLRSFCAQQANSIEDDRMEDPQISGCDFQTMVVKLQICFDTLKRRRINTSISAEEHEARRQFILLCSAITDLFEDDDTYEY